MFPFRMKLVFFAMSKLIILSEYDNYIPFPL